MAVGAAALLPKSLWAGASQPSTPVSFAVPAGACDCHTHIFGDPRRFPLWSGRTYTPESASVKEMRALHRALHTERVVIVNPSIYGTDNSCTLDAVKQLGPGARAIAVIDEKTSDARLDEMARGGVRGIRLNLKPSERPIRMPRGKHSIRPWSASPDESGTFRSTRTWR